MVLTTAALASTLRDALLLMKGRVQYVRARTARAALGVLAVPVRCETAQRQRVVRIFVTATNSYLGAPHQVQARACRVQQSMELVVPIAQVVFVRRVTVQLAGLMYVVEMSI
jgi:hypothetical protein